MSRPVIVVRPEPGCAATVAAGRAQGLDMRAFPLFEVHPRSWQLPPDDSFDALLLGSANAVRHAGDALTSLRGKPAYAVGEATAEAARGAGLEVAGIGRGGLQSVLDTLRGPLRLLRLAGEDHVPLKLLPGITIDTRIVYTVEPRPLPPELADTLRNRAVVMLHSASAARHFAAECDRLGVSRARVAVAALGPRIADAAGGGWRVLRSAQIADERALLALAGDLCHASDEAKER